jgi:flagellar protein FlaF
MQQGALNSYTAMQKEGLSGRALEAQVLTRAANLLKECQNRWGEDGHEERFDTAVRFNQKVWTFFQTELAEPENPLPREIRENLLNLSIYIDSRLIDALINPAPELLADIININLNIAAGLREKPTTEALSSTTAEPRNIAVSA